MLKSDRGIKKGPLSLILDPLGNPMSEQLTFTFQMVKKKTKSHVQEFGNISMSSDKIHEYQGVT